MSIRSPDLTDSIVTLSWAIASLRLKWFTKAPTPSRQAAGRGDRTTSAPTAR